jgi:hypothetical protein
MGIPISATTGREDHEKKFGSGVETAFTNTVKYASGLKDASLSGSKLHIYKTLQDFGTSSIASYSRKRTIWNYMQWQGGRAHLLGPDKKICSQSHAQC